MMCRICLLVYMCDKLNVYIYIYIYIQCLFTDVFCKTCACTYKYANVCILCWTRVFAKFCSLFPLCYLFIQELKEKWFVFFGASAVQVKVPELLGTCIPSFWRSLHVLNILGLSFHPNFFSSLFEWLIPVILYFNAAYIFFCCFGAFDDEIQVTWCLNCPWWWLFLTCSSLWKLALARQRADQNCA